jgi:formylmethanofuran dehydrogenase subunit E
MSVKINIMLCSKCHENILQGKEIQIAGTMICKKCALVVEKTNKKKVITRC